MNAVIIAIVCGLVVGFMVICLIFGLQGKRNRKRGGRK